MNASMCRIALAAVVTLALNAASAAAQSSFEVLHQLVEPAYPPIGKLLEASNGRLYGVAQYAGTFGKGAVLAYHRQPDGTVTATVVHAFSGPDGATPLGGVIEGSDGALYGTTYEGGSANFGTVYRIGSNGSFGVLHSFQRLPGQPALGGNPRAELVEASDGHLYGTATGVVFRLTKAGVHSLLHDPTADQPDFVSIGGLEDALIDGGDGKLYGISGEGCRGTHGCVFSITLAGEFTALHNFTRPGPMIPLSLIDGRDGFFYGTTMDAHDDARSTIFRISRTGAFAVLYTNTSHRTTAVSFDTLIRGTDGNFYGTTNVGGATNEGTLFRLSPAGSLTTLHAFRFTFGSRPGAIIQTADGTLFGSTGSGGFARRGVIFRSTTSGQYAVVNHFTGADPLWSFSRMVAGPDGALYGVSCAGGTLNAGTVFKLTADGTVLTVLHSFAYWDGMCPSGPLAFGLDGALYGTAALYGLGGGGTIFRITTAGGFTVSRFFSGPDGAQPMAGLLRASDGHLYGTTTRGGAHSSGTIFRLGSGGAFTTLYAFGTASLESGSGVPLMQASDGHIYGASLLGPFRLALSGTVTSFSPMPVMLGALVQGLDGHLYGTTKWDFDRPATLFRLTLQGVPTVVHTFARTTDDPAPCHGLLLAPDGTFYGTGCYGDGGGTFPGSIFQFFGSGAPATIHTFEGPDLLFPSELTLGADGALYGGIAASGPNPAGRALIYRLRLP